MTREMAIKLLKDYRKIIVSLDSAGITATGIDNQSEMKAIRKTVGNMLNECWTELVSPILALYPDFKRDDYTLSFIDEMVE